MATAQSNIRKMGSLLKLKTNKKKYFILREDPASMQACLEYYDSEKKYRSGQRPKRSIPVSDCFSINPKSDAKHKYAIALFTKDDCFAVVCDNEEDQKSWLEIMLELRSSNSPNGTSKPLFEHIWPVNVKPRGLGSHRHLSPGPYRLCLTNQSLGFVRLNHEEPDIVFQLASIRRCGHRDAFFFMELGRSSVTGPGELWLQVEDTVIAQNMHEAILSSMKTNSSGEKQPSFRPRSQSSTEKVTKPIPIHPHNSQTKESTRGSTLPKRHLTITGADNLHRHGHKASHSPNKKGAVPPRPVSAVVSFPPMPSSPPSSYPIMPDPHRARTNSIDSRASSVSADEVDTPTSHLIPPNSGTGPSVMQSDPDLKNYLDMTPVAQAVRSFELECSEYMDMKPGSDTGGQDLTPTQQLTPSAACIDVAANDDPYLDMSPGMQNINLGEDVYMEVPSANQVSSPDGNEEMKSFRYNTAYMDMSPSTSGLSSTHNSISETDGGYIDMCVGGSSPQLRNSPSGQLQRVISYLREDHQPRFVTDDFPKRAGSVGSKSAVLQPKDPYVDMSGNNLQEKKSSSTPHLNDGPLLDSSADSSQHSLRERQEMGDLFMEVTFSSSQQHSLESLELRPRTSSHGSFKDFRSRTSSGGSQSEFRGRTCSFEQEDRQRLASAGTRDKISRLASYVRRSQRSQSELIGDDHRPRVATICQDSLRPRTSSFGSGDMRPRSSSHGNARLRELKGSCDPSQHSSQESLKRFHKRSSVDSINSTNSDYLDMNPKLGSSPSQPPVSSMKQAAEAESDYMSMEPSAKDSCDSGYVPMFTPGKKTTSSFKVNSDSKGKSRSKSNSLEKKGASSNSSTESLSSTGSVEHKSRKRYSKVMSQSDSYMKMDLSEAVPKDIVNEKTDAYVTYSPGSGRDPGQGLSSALEKVTSPIRSDAPPLHDSARLASSRSQDKSKKKGHEYINLDYSGDKNIREPLWEDEDVNNSGVSLPKSQLGASKGGSGKASISAKVTAPSLPSTSMAPATRSPTLATTEPSLGGDKNTSACHTPPLQPVPSSSPLASLVASTPISTRTLPLVPTPESFHLPLKTPSALPQVPIPSLLPQTSAHDTNVLPEDDILPTDPFKLNAKANKSSGEMSPRPSPGTMPSRGSCGSLTGLDKKTPASMLRERSQSNQFLGILLQGDELDAQPAPKTSLDNVSDQGITYATLDLASSREEMAGSSSSVCDKARHESGEEPVTTAISYAEIDFEHHQANPVPAKFSM